MIGLSFEMDFNSDELRKQLIDNGVKAAIERASRRAAAEILADAKQNTPVGKYGKKKGKKSKKGKKEQKGEKDEKGDNGKKGRTAKRVGGTLKKGWKISQYPKTAGCVTTIEISNPVHYASYVEHGHKTRNGGFVQGKFMLEKAVNRTHNRLQEIFDAELKKI